MTVKRHIHMAFLEEAEADSGLRRTGRVDGLPVVVIADERGVLPHGATGYRSVLPVLRNPEDERRVFDSLLGADEDEAGHGTVPDDLVPARFVRVGNDLVAPLVEHPRELLVASAGVVNAGHDAQA